MAENKHTHEELHQYQALSLDAKIAMTRERIRGWVKEYGEDGVYVSFSGGKDSTVLLDIVRNVCGYKNVPAVFVDTGLEYPEIREFVKTFDNVTWLKPKMTFKQVIEKYGYPFISKEVSECVQGARKYLTELMKSESLDRQTDRQSLMHNFIKKYADSESMRNQSRGGTITSTESCVDLASIPQRMAIMLGQYDKWYQMRKGIIPRKDGNRSQFSQVKYKFFLNAPFDISNRCCNVMKKNPAHTYSRQFKKNPMTAEMASESRLRTQKWIQNGCNGFNMKEPKSTPMAFWTEQDVLLYIKTRNLPICSVYGEIVEDLSGTDEVEGQMTISDLEGYEGMELFDAKRLPLKTTGCDRTGCMFCGYGCHLEKEGEGRFERMKVTHPKTYEYIMKPWEDGGLNYKEVIDWINENGNLNIRY